MAAFFGPVTLVWFIAIAIAGLWHVGQNLAVLYAFDPIYGVEFLASHGLIGLVTLGAVFLAVTGSETLYAALGHFGRGPIRLFRSSSALASAYGIAVSGTRRVTAMMAFVVAALGGRAADRPPSLPSDLTFLGANQRVRGRLDPAGARWGRDGGDVYLAPRHPALV